MTQIGNKNKIHASTELGIVTLNVKDLDGMVDFYSNAVGLELIKKTNNSTLLGIGARGILNLDQRVDLSNAKPGSAGLYHTAILFESSLGLAIVLKRMLETVPQLFEGSGDHFVSQAFYFHDPEGNGVELYVDRQRDEWKWKNGKIEMGLEYIHPATFIEQNQINSGNLKNIKIGHIHLKVGNILKAKDFYVNTLGFDITHEIPTALFLSAGGYHHHLGMNIWESTADVEREETLGLGSYQIMIPNLDEMDRIEKTLVDKKIFFEKSSELFVTFDPWGNKIIFALAH